jgi:hypothetical protein
VSVERPERDERDDAAAWLDEDPETIAARTRGVHDDLLPAREPRPRRRAYGYVSRGRS